MNTFQQFSPHILNGFAQISDSPSEKQSFKY